MVWDGWDCANYCTPSFRHPSCEASQDECCRTDSSAKKAEVAKGEPQWSPCHDGGCGRCPSCKQAEAKHD